MPKVSVVIPCYNHGEFLQETLDSLQDQTYTDYEIIVVNDGSTDPATVRLLESLERPRTRVVHTVNCGVSAARNRGIAEAVGKYILPLDSDDKLGPGFLEQTVRQLDINPNVAIVFCERVLFGEREGVVSLPAYNPVAILFDNCIYPAALFRKADWETVGGYSEKMVYGWEDWEFWISLSGLQKQVVKIQEPLFFYRVRNNSRDHSLQFHQKIAMMSVIVLRHKRLYLRHLDLFVKKVISLFLDKPST